MTACIVPYSPIAISEFTDDRAATSDQVSSSPADSRNATSATRAPTKEEGTGASTSSIDLAQAAQAKEDPLAAYEEFVKWTIDNYPSNLIPKSGLLELLEEATRQFKDDAAYKADLRYTKLWMLYAAYVDDERTHVAIQVYKFLVQNEIGKMYAQVYEEYAAALERAGRCALPFRNHMGGPTYWIVQNSRR